MQKVKKLCAAFLCMGIVMTSLLIPASAEEGKETVIDLGNGFYVVETLTQYPMSRSGNTASGQKTANLYQGTTLIGTSTFLAAFDISGSTARATDANISGVGLNGWEYVGGTTKLSGNKATGTATYRMNSSTKSHTITITCSPSGVLS